MLTISVRGTPTSATSGASAAASVAPAIPTGTVAGDVMVAFLSTDSNGAVSTPAGWTAQGSIAQSTVSKLWYFTRAWVTGDAAPTLGLTSGTAQMAGGIVSLINVDTSFPVAGIGTSTNASASSTLATAAGSPTGLGVFQVSAIGHRNTTAARTVTPTTLTEQIDASTTASAFIGLWVGTRDYTSSGINAAAAINQTASGTATRESATLFFRPAQNSSDITPDFAAGSDDTAGAATISVSAFSTNRASEMLVAFVGISGAGTGPYGTSTVSGAGLTWIKQKEVAIGNAGLTSAVWTAWSASTLSAQTITATSSSAGDDVSLTVVSFYGGVNSAGTSTSTSDGASGNTSLSLTTTQNNSLVVAASGAQGGTSFSAGASQSIIRSKADTFNGVEIGSLIRSAVTATSGTAVTMSNTSNGTSSSIVAYELLSVTPGVTFIAQPNRIIQQAVNRAGTY